MMMIRTLFVFTALLLLSVAMHWVSGSFDNSLSGHPDEPSHFLTGLMIRDWLLGFPHPNPMAFVYNYYEHYPKIALGHWPPLFYGALGVWFVIFPATHVSALLMMTLVTAALATTLYCCLNKRFGWASALLAAVLFVIVPLTQAIDSLIMTGTLVSLLSILATLAFARFLKLQTASSSLLFAIIASAAILTRGSAFSLALVPVIAIILTHRQELLYSWRLWISVIPVSLFCLPWYFATREYMTGTWAGAAGFIEYEFDSFVLYGAAYFTHFGPALLIPALIGFHSTVIKPWKNDGVTPFWASLTALLIATIIFHLSVPASIELRFLMPTLFPMMAFFVAGSALITQRVSAFGLSNAVSHIAVYGVILALFIKITFFVVDSRSHGYQQAASIAVALTEPDATLLISSDSIGEGSFVAEVAIQSQRPDGRYVLRGSKKLSSSDWIGRDYKLLLNNPQAIIDYLNTQKVQLIAIDRSIPEENQRPDMALLEQTLAQNSHQWQPVGTVFITRKTKQDSNQMQLFHRVDTTQITTQLIPK